MKARDSTSQKGGGSREEVDNDRWEGDTESRDREGDTESRDRERDTICMAVQREAGKGGCLPSRECIISSYSRGREKDHISR